MLLLGLLTVYPLSTLVYGSLHSTPPGMPGEYNLNGYAKVFTLDNLDILGNSIAIAFTKSAIAVALAVLFGLIVARTDTPYRGALEVLITLPFFVPPDHHGLSVGDPRQPQGRCDQYVLRWLTGTHGTIVNVYCLRRRLAHGSAHNSGSYFLLVVDAFGAMDRRLRNCRAECQVPRAGRHSGASRLC